MSRAEFLVRGMDCAEEVATLKGELSLLPGVGELAFDLMHRKLTVDFDETATAPDAIRSAVSRTGMKAELWSERQDDDETREAQRRRALLTTVSGSSVAIGFALHALASGWRDALTGSATSALPPAVMAAYLVAVATGSWHVVPKAWHALRRLRPDMNLLMCIAVAGALGIGEWFEAATVSFLFALSLALEAWSVGRARGAIASLMALSPAKARVLGPGNNEVEVEASSVAVGATVLVKPGEKFPLDGRVVSGRTTVNQAPITGESAPVVKEIGSEVFAGTVNEDGAVEIRTVKPFSDSMLSQIAKMVGEAHARRSPSEQWVERFARVYTPVVLVAAILVAAVPPLFGGDWSRWSYQALVLLVIACPCALVISTPVSIVASLVAAARHGVLVKGGLFIELPSKIVAIALDKTGTLTEGRPVVQRVVPRSGHSEQELLTIAASIESRSTHPLARAIVAHASARGIEADPATGFQLIPGKGAHAQVNGVDHWLGSHRYLEERGQEEPDVHHELEALTASGASVVVVGREDHVCGFISLADKLRPNAAAVLAELRREGIQRIVMLTGDNRGTGEVIGREAGVDEVRAELLPQDKIGAIEELVRRYGTVAMVGDGVNDAPALARANLGIAMGAVGTDAALETADVALMGDDLSRLPWLVRHSRRTLGIIRQNIAASIAVKILFVGLSVAGHASLWGAIAADMGISLLVVANALRLLRVSSRNPATRLSWR